MNIEYQEVLYQLNSGLFGHTCGRSKGGCLEKKSQQFPNETEGFVEQRKGRCGEGSLIREIISNQDFRVMLGWMFYLRITNHICRFQLIVVLGR